MYKYKYHNSDQYIYKYVIYKYHNSDQFRFHPVQFKAFLIICASWLHFYIIRCLQAQALTFEQPFLYHFRFDTEAYATRTLDIDASVFTIVYKSAS